ncbi:hypothetical protein ONE63_009224 [Megalurothrips usitatus]|uniref:Sarcoplasmic calcium-binding proteins II, V, VI, and VII n=1 Tax=Megalurothrips usitatus TaxID=439358 RepID=A0AAV7XN37_9NEOP|nr:hypothetical protein ONE63_009224 [Megalurothrips usitatus]
MENGGGLVTKVLNKRTDSARDLKPDGKEAGGKSHRSKGKENKKESSAGLQQLQAAGAAGPQLAQPPPLQPRGSTGSCTSAASAGDGKDAVSGKEVKFRDPESGAGGGGAEDGDAASAGGGSGSGSPKVPHKFISNWKHACDKTRDRTRDLLKRWRTAPEGMEHAAAAAAAATAAGQAAEQGQSHGWSVHVWATWVKRLPSEEEGFLKAEDDNSAALLSPVQREKLSQFFAYLVDGDRDDIVSRQDFENLSERLRHFADWSDNSSEYHILREVEHNFIVTFLEAEPRDDRGSGSGASGSDEGFVVCPTGQRERICSLEQWLSRWGALLDKAKTFSELPVWLQYFPRVMFAVINKSGTGVVSRDELSAFYSSVLGLGAQRVGEVLDAAYKAMTANGDHPLCFPAYRWCYANFLLGRHRNGPGQYLFGPGEPADLRGCPFPVDYSALNTAPEELEQYSPDRKSNRRSVVV